MSTTRIARLATVEDAAILAELLDAFNREFRSPTPGVDVLVANLIRLLTQPTTFAVVAGSPVVGFGLVTLRTNVWLDGSVALLDELYTIPSERSRGWGAAVLDLAVGEARRRGAQEFEIEVDEPDVDAHRFYARHGFPVRDADTGARAFVLRREFGTPAS